MSVKVINVTELLELQNDPEVLIIDVREKQEIAETGVLPGGINIPLAELETSLSKTDEDFGSTFGKKKPDMTSKIVFSCRSGKRSTAASEKAVQMGFKNVHNFTGGWLGWDEYTKRNS